MYHSLKDIVIERIRSFSDDDKKRIDYFYKEMSDVESYFGWNFRKKSIEEIATEKVDEFLAIRELLSKKLEL